MTMTITITIPITTTTTTTTTANTIIIANSNSWGYSSETLLKAPVYRAPNIARIDLKARGSRV